MNWTTIQILLQTALKAGGGAMLANGWATDSQVTDLIGAVMTIIGFAWSKWSHKAAGSNTGNTEGTKSAEKTEGAKVLGILLLCALVTLCAIGCGTLAPDGVYHGDKALFHAEQAITGADAVMHSFISWELANRSALAKNPEITEAADVIRKNAQRWISTAIALRDAYAANPTPDGRANLERGLDTLQSAVLQAQTYLTTPLN